MENNTNIPPKPDNYLVWAILSTVLCCIVTGIPV
nr:CD225/dispanin family protein [Allomuricauda sp.]